MSHDAPQNRVTEWQRTHDLRSLWPDLDSAYVQRAHTQLRRIAETLLRSDTATATLESNGGEELRALGLAGFLSGTGPLLGWWSERGRLSASAPARELLALHLDHGRRRAATLQAELFRLLGVLRDADIHPVLLKGMHTGPIYFPEPGTRPAADLDLLIRPEERGRTAAALARAGLVERRRTRFAARSEWIRPDAPRAVRSLDIDHADGPWSLDLHVSLDRWYFRGVRRGVGPDATSMADIGGSAVRVLRQPQLLAHLAMHASQELVKVRLVRLVELALVAHRDTMAGTLDWSALLELLRRGDAERFAYPALALAQELAPDAIPDAVVRELGRGATDRLERVVAAVRAADFAPLTTRSLDAKLMWARGPRELLLNASEILLPSDDGLPLRGGALQAQRLRAIWAGRARLKATRPR